MRRKQTIEREIKKKKNQAYKHRSLYIMYTLFTIWTCLIQKTPEMSKRRKQQQQQFQPMEFQFVTD